MKQFLFLTLIIITAITNATAQTVLASGTCGAQGDNLTWTLTVKGVLTISGSGEMKDYADENYWKDNDGGPWRFERFDRFNQRHIDIKTIIIGDSVTTIGNSAFIHSNGLTSVTIGSSVRTIGSGAFEGCSSLASVIIPKSVADIRARTFADCHNLTSIIIPNSVKTIGQATFCNCRKLTSVTIPNSITSIGCNTFSSCYSLTSITIPNGVTFIGCWAFFNSGLTSVTIPNSVATIEERAFSLCSNLASVTIPSSVTTIGVGAFANNSSLTSIDIDVNNLHYIFDNGVLFNKSKTTLVQYLFSNTNISYTIPSSVLIIGEEAFYNNSVTSVIIPNSVTTIEKKAFDGCVRLTSVIIGNRVTTIGAAAFSRCHRLSAITCYALTPPNLDLYVFDSVNKKSCTLFVPAESIELYQQTPIWKDFQIAAIKTNL